MGKEQSKAHACYPSSLLKEEDVTASHFSRERMQATMAPKITEEVTPPGFPNKELEIGFAPTIEENGITEEVVVTFECLGRIELASSSTLTSKEGIPIIKEQAMSTTKFSGEAWLGSASTLMTKEGTTTRKEEDVTTSEFSGQEGLRSTPLTEEITVTLELPIQEEQGTTTTPTYSSRDEYKISTTPMKERKPEEVVVTFECSG